MIFLNLAVFAVYNKTERLSASKSPTKKKAETSFKPVTLHVADVTSYINHYNESNLSDSRNASFGTTANLSNVKPFIGSFFNTATSIFSTCFGCLADSSLSAT